MKKTLLFLLSPVLLFAGAIALLLRSETEYHKSVQPPPGDVHLVDFLNSERQLLCVEEAVINGETYTMVTGCIPNITLALPSGPPAYVFDARHILIDWCADIGDNSDFVKKWITQNVWTKKETDEPDQMQYTGNSRTSGGATSD